MRPRTATAIVLVVVNGLSYSSWYWLRGEQLSGNRRDNFLETRYLPDGPETRISSQSVLRNDGYAQPLFDLMKSEKRILMLGTSESIHDHNISFQMNAMTETPPKTHIFAQAGMSPIHLSFFFAKCERDKLELPPIVLLINLVYFTESHDVLNDGWLSRVMPSEIFLEMNHGKLLDYVDEDVRDLFEDHFANRRWLAPLTVQKYLGNLIFLRFNQPKPVAAAPDGMANDRYIYDGKLPNYDEHRNVWKSYHARDRMQMNRWEVKKVNECINLIGLRSIFNSVESGDTPFLAIIMPTNRAYYRDAGLDMETYDQRYAAIREAIKSMPRKSTTSILDLYDEPVLDRGFRDRMHADQYGHHQLAKFILTTPEYREFRQQARDYFEKRD